MALEYIEGYGIDFFKFDGKIAFIQERGCERMEVEPESFFKAEEEAKKMFTGVEPEKYLIKVKIHQLLGDEKLGLDGKINLLAAETFPKDLELRRLYLRDLSIDMPKYKLNPAEKKRLEQALAENKKSQEEKIK
jgi:hypothetical protein